MRPPKFLGKIIYIVGKPLQVLLLMNSRRAYVVIVHNKRMLVTQNWLGTHETWRLPGGGLHRHEQPLQGALREVTEEVGITLQSDDVAAITNEPIRANSRFWFWLFVTYPHTQPPIAIDPKEISAAQWIPIAELLNYKVSYELEQALQYLQRSNNV